LQSQLEYTRGVVVSVSTKIWNAYECEFKSIDEMQEKLLSIRLFIWLSLLSKMHKRVAWDWVYYVDKNTLEGKPIEKKFYEVSQEVSERYEKIKSSGIRDVDYDFYFEVVVIPHKGKQYLKVFFDDVDIYSDLFEKIGKDFHYQNCTDKPKDISEEEWERRMETWDEILGDNPWNKVGFIYDFSLHPVFDFPFNPKEIPKGFFPNKHMRANVIARKTMFDTIKSFPKWREYIETEEGKKELENKTKEIEDKLIDDIVIHEINSITC
jgi:hypothetical protein